MKYVGCRFNNTVITNKYLDRVIEKSKNFKSPFLSVHVNVFAQSRIITVIFQYDFLVPDFLVPSWFLCFAIKRGLRKSGYLGKIEFLSERKLIGFLLKR